MKMIFNAVAAVLILIGIGLSYWQYSKILGKEVADGRVTALKPQRSSRGGTLYTVVAQFADRSRQTHTYRSGFSSSDPGYKIGDSIRIWFDQNNPADCGILSFGYRFGVGWLFIVAGLSIWIACLGWGFGNRWLEGRFPTTVSAQPPPAEYSPEAR